VTGSVVCGQTTRASFQSPAVVNAACGFLGSGAFDIGLGHRGDPGPVRLIDHLGQLMR
jgi:hypothetical protein